MFKDILVNLPAAPARDAATAFAVSLAAEFKARLTGIAFRYEPIAPVMVDMYVVPPEIIESQRAETEKSAKAAIARFEEVARGAAVAADARSVEVAVADAPATLADIARRFDLCALAQPQPDDTTLGRQFIEAVLFESGRPILIVPYIQTAGLKLDRVMVGWDGSRSAARAVGDAMPLLAKAAMVEIVMVSAEAAKSDELPGTDIALHLARHGVQVEVERIASSDVDPANIILSRAADTSADLLVMGGYGHSRMREFILGGVTRAILGSMTVPTFMSH
jgi:nucleotide-binding universal stress UspA family protein